MLLDALTLLLTVDSQVLLEQDGVSDQEPQETHELVRRWRAKVPFRALCCALKMLLSTHP